MAKECTLPSSLRRPARRRPPRPSTAAPARPPAPPARVNHPGRRALTRGFARRAPQALGGGDPNLYVSCNTYPTPSAFGWKADSVGPDSLIVSHSDGGYCANG